MRLWPAIDLLRGQAVRLYQGSYEQVTVYERDPVSLCSRFREDARQLHVVDLEGARAGNPVQADLVAHIVRAFGKGVQVAGGIRDRAAVDRYFEVGAERVVLGTAAIRDPALVRSCALAYPHRIVVAVDAKDGMVATDGWLSVSTRTSVDLVRELAELPLASVLYTDIARDGTGSGPNIDATTRLARDGGVPVLASGGIGVLDHLRKLAVVEGVEGAIVGRALYENAFTLRDAVKAAGDAAPPWSTPPEET
jgi:phosphoribosylformimino-5-aminoimidazole carboxamide ribotide isomerase